MQEAKSPDISLTYINIYSNETRKRDMCCLNTKMMLQDFQGFEVFWCMVTCNAPLKCKTDTFIYVKQNKVKQYLYLLENEKDEATRVEYYKGNFSI